MINSTSPPSPAERFYGALQRTAAAAAPPAATAEKKSVLESLYDAPDAASGAPASPAVAPAEPSPVEAAAPAAEPGAGTPAAAPAAVGDFFDGFANVARGQGMQDERTRALFDAVAPQFEQHVAQRVSSLREQWTGLARADAEIGGSNWSRTSAMTDTILARFGTPALREVLEATGLVEHPEFRRLLVRMSQPVR